MHTWFTDETRGSSEARASWKRIHASSRTLAETWEPVTCGEDARNVPSVNQVCMRGPTKRTTPASASARS